MSSTAHVRAANAVYRPELFKTRDGANLYGPPDESKKRQRKRTRQQLDSSRRGEDEHACSKRVRGLLTNVYRGNEAAFFQPCDIDALVFDTRDQWYADEEHVRARIVNPQFKLYSQRGASCASARRSGHKAKDAYENQLARCEAPSEEEIVNAEQMSVTFFFEYVRDVGIRLRQLGGRQHNKAITHISTFVAVFNADPSKPLTAEMRERLDNAKSKRTKCKNGNACDRQMLGIVTMVVESILNGENMFVMHVYDMLLGEVGKKYAPETHAYLTRMHNIIRSNYLQIKHDNE